MIKVFGVGRGAKKKDDGGTGEAASSDATADGKKQPGEIRIQKELDELDVPPQCKLQFPDKNNIMSFVLDLRPDEGFWRSATYRFTFTISPLYPHEAPKVKCDTKIYHPNIDLQGNVCLNILREEWKPVLSISSVIYGILHLFSEPNPNDPLNHEAAKMLRDDRFEFERVVARSLRGFTFQGAQFPRLV
ncbi:unnamed protein product [Amoebophrya sp. A25]|nr:unnamed protein product [Amoebophrya sp. A25]|eukprot:GSA25T00024610001.1